MTNDKSSAPTSAQVKAPTQIEKEQPIKEIADATSAGDAASTNEKKRTRPTVIVLLVCLGVLILGGLIFAALTLFGKPNGTYHAEKYKGGTYYIIDKDFPGDYDIQYKTFTDEELFGEFAPCDGDDCDYIYVCDEDEEDCEYFEEAEELVEEDDENVSVGTVDLDSMMKRSQQLMDAVEKCNSYSDSAEKAKCLSMALNEYTGTDSTEDDLYDNEDYEDYEDDWYDDEDYKGYEDYLDSIIDSLNTTEIYDYETYKDFCERWGYKQKYSDKNLRYAIMSVVYDGASEVEARLGHVGVYRNEMRLYVWDNYEETEDNVYVGYLIVVPFDNREITDIDYEVLYTQAEFEEIKSLRDFPVAEKPIIYLYPEKKAEVSVKLGQPGLVTTSYPKYTDGWNVIAEPNGTLVDSSTGRELYSLYYESDALNKPELAEGFVVKGEDSTEFLEEKLAILGLTEREAEEFIVYWLPKLEANNYNLIRFETAEEIAKSMPLSISPEPDTLIRVMMDYKPLDETIEIKKQILETPTRSGFVVVEWGGSKL